MTQCNTSSNVLSTIAILPGIIALTWQIISWYRSRSSYKYDTLDKHLFDLLCIAIDKPNLRSDKWVHEQLQKDKNDIDRLIYEAYAALCLNVVETAFDKYKSDLMTTHFSSAIKTLLNRHKMYYEQHSEAYKSLSKLYEKIG